MATLRQVKQVAIGLYEYDGSFTQVYPTLPAGLELYDIYNLDARWRADWLGGSASKRALSGFDRMNFGGYRLDCVISLRNMTPTQASKIMGLINNIFQSGGEPRKIGISPSDDVNDIIYCNLRNSAYGLRRELTVGRQVLNMQLTGVFRVTTIPDAWRIG